MPSTPLSRPLHVLVGRAHEEDVEAHRIGAVLVDDRVRPVDVALRLRHLRPAERHPALVEQARERLAEADQAPVVQRLDEEARVEQVARRVVDAADVLGRPAASSRRRRGRTAPRRCAGRCSAGSTRTSRRTCPSCRHRAAPGRRTAGSRRAMYSSFEASGALPFGRVVLDVGQEHRQLLVGHGHDAALLAVDDRDRAAPVALPREAPVAQAVVDRRLAAALLARAHATIARLRLVRRQPVERPGVDELRRPRRSPERPAGRTSRRTRASRSSCAGTAMIAPVP